jgi:hypothetical protein
LACRSWRGMPNDPPSNAIMGLLIVAVAMVVLGEMGAFGAVVGIIIMAELWLARNLMTPMTYLLIVAAVVSAFGILAVAVVVLSEMH